MCSDRACRLTLRDVPVISVIALELRSYVSRIQLILKLLASASRG